MPMDLWRADDIICQHLIQEFLHLLSLVRGGASHRLADWWRIASVDAVAQFTCSSESEEICITKM